MQLDPNLLDLIKQKTEELWKLNLSEGEITEKKPVDLQELQIFVVHLAENVLAPAILKELKKA